MATRLQLFNCRHETLLRGYEEHLGQKHGRKTQRANYTRRMMEQAGSRYDAVTKSVNRRQPSAGLKGLAAIDRLEWSDEQLVCEFADLFPDNVVQRATEALAMCGL